MFQSSRIASGNCLRQASSACPPSSASTIWNSSPSRMRRATLRMTLESSTTKHVFMCVSSCFNDPSVAVSCREYLAADVENTVDIDHDKQLSVQAVNAR